MTTVGAPPHTHVEPFLKPPAQPKLAEEMRKMEAEPLLPVEKKLIAWSIGLGLVLLAVLVWVSYTFFPAGH